MDLLSKAFETNESTKVAKSMLRRKISATIPANTPTHKKQQNFLLENLLANYIYFETQYRAAVVLSHMIV